MDNWISEKKKKNVKKITTDLEDSQLEQYCVGGTNNTEHSFHVPFFYSFQLKRLQ